MYTRFFNLAQSPFSIAPDPRYLFMSERHREALAHLLYGIDSGGGFVLLTGEIGAGKTTVCRCFLEQVPAHCKVAYIFNPKLTVTDLLQSICDEFGIAPAPGAASRSAVPSVKAYVDALNAYLLSAHADGRNNLLIIDEAQNLSPDVLEQLRLLTNLETNERKLLQIILIGQPELRTMLESPGLEQLAQRVIARYHLGPLTAAETSRYIDHRLAVAGLGSGRPFAPATLPQIHRLTGGVPRRINLLCDRALLGAYAEGRQTVDRGIVTKAAREVFGAAGGAPSRRSPRLKFAALGAVAALAGTALVGATAWSLSGAGPFAISAADRLAPLARFLPRARDAAGSPGEAIGMAGPVKVAPAAAPTAAATPSTSTPSAAPGQIPAPGRKDARAADKPHAGPASSPPLQSPQNTDTAVAGAIRFPATVEQDDNGPYRRLAGLWGAQLADGNACSAAAAVNLHCFRSNGGLAEIRQLDRPAVLTLRDDAGRAHYALLTGLSTVAAVLAFGPAQPPQTVTLVALGRHFEGQFGTFWHMPQSFRIQVRSGDRGPEVDWLATQLARQDGSPPPASGRLFDQALAVRVREFQAAHGLERDGVVGPKTYMHLNNVAGLDEPHLKAGIDTKNAVREK